LTKGFKLLGAVVIIFVITALIIFIASGQKGTYLVIEHNGTILYKWEIHIGETFELSYTHSVTLSRIYDTFAWTEQGLFLTNSREGAFHSAEMLVPVGALPILTWDLPGHVLYFKTHRVVLHESAGINEKILIHVMECIRYAEKH
jgi:hypothetical protein